MTNAVGQWYAGRMEEGSKRFPPVLLAALAAVVLLAGWFLYQNRSEPAAPVSNGTDQLPKQTNIKYVAPDGWEHHTDEANRISLYYPAAWKASGQAALITSAPLEEGVPVPGSQELKYFLDEDSGNWYTAKQPAAGDADIVKGEPAVYTRSVVSLHSIVFSTTEFQDGAMHYILIAGKTKLYHILLPSVAQASDPEVQQKLAEQKTALPEIVRSIRFLDQ